MIIKVTAEHIAKGKRKALCSCPVALALTESFHQTCYVTTFELGFTKNLGLPRIPGFGLQTTTPIEVAKFVEIFDIGGVVEPFEFEIPYD